MGRTINFDFRRGGGSAAEVLYGTLTLTPSAYHQTSAATVLPEATKVELNAGLASLPNVEPSPSGESPAWVYVVTVTSHTSSRAWSFMVGVPDGTTAIAFKDLPKYLTPGKGVQIVTGKSAYQSAVDAGFVGTEVQWLASLKGTPGATGAPGPNTIPTAEAITTQTGIVSASSYGVVGDGVADDTAKLQAAINATASGQKLVIPALTYKLTSALSVTGKSITIEGYGATLVASGNHGILNFTGAYGTIHAATGIAQVMIPNGEVETWATTITLSTAPTLVRGDVVKVYSDDLIAGARPGDGTVESRIGEFAIVDSVSGSVVTLMGYLRETYTTNTKLVKVEPHTAHLRGIKATASLASATSGLIGFIRLVAPTVQDVVITKSGGTGINFVGCYTYTARDVSVYNSVNNPTAGQYGYGILDASCSFGLIVGFKARHVRHAYTDDSGRIAANSQPDNYGRTFGTQVVDSTVHGATVTGWDTHHAAENVSFINCQAINSYAGFTLRGRKHRIRNGYVRGGKNALSVFTEMAGCESWGHDIVGLNIEGMQETPISFYVNSHNGVRETRPSSLRDIRIAASNYANAGIRTQNATVDIWDTVITAPATLPDSAALISGQNSELRGGDVVLDTVANAAGATLALFESSAGTTHRFDGVRVRNTAASALRTQSFRNAASDIIRVSNALLDYAPQTSATTSSADIIYGFRYTQAAGTSFSFIQPGANISVRVSRSDAARVTAGISTSGTTATLTALLAGRIEAQELRINNIGTVGLIIPHGSAFKTLMLGAADKTLTVKQGVTLTWDGTNWVETN